MTHRAAGARWWWRTSCLLLAGLAGWCRPSPGSAAFEFSGVVARVLGGALAAGGESDEAVWFNPAGNARGQGWQAGSTHVLLYPELDETVSLNALAAVGRWGGGAIQAGWSSLGAPDWQEQVALIGYSRPLLPRLALGVSLRSSGWETKDLSRRSLSADVGGMYEVGWIHPRAYLRLGGVLRNLGRAGLAAGGAAEGRSPRGYIAGADLRLLQQDLLVDVERSGGRTRVRAGYENASPLEGVTFRLGAGWLVAPWAGEEAAAGMGYTWKQWQFEYAYAYPLRLAGFGGMHQVSIGYRPRRAGRGLL